LAVVAGKGARDGAGNGYGEKSQGLSCALWFVLQKSREEGGSGEVRRWWRPRFSLFFFLPREGAAAERGTRLGLGFFYFCFPPQNFSAPPPFKFYCRLIYIELFFSFLFFSFLNFDFSHFFVFF
jgi:hypothetical protein